MRPARGTAGEQADGHGVREQHLVKVGRIAAVVAIVIAVLTARPLVGSSEQAFQFIQEFTGFFTPGITVIFLLGLFWKRANEAGAIAAGDRLGRAILGIQAGLGLAAVHWTGWAWCFLIALGLAVAVSLVTASRADTDTIATRDVSFATRASFNIGAVAVCLIPGRPCMRPGGDHDGRIHRRIRIARVDALSCSLRQ